MKLTLSICAVILLSLYNAQDCNADDDIRKVSQYFSGKTSGTTFYQKAFEYSWTYSPFDGREVAKWIGGDSSDAPDFVISNLDITLDGIKIEIPKKAYWDLYDPQVQGAPPFIMEDQKHVYMVIYLSDGAGSATVSLKFRDGKYVGREIQQRK